MSKLDDCRRWVVRFHWLRTSNLSLLVNEALMGYVGRAGVSTGFAMSVIAAGFLVIYKDRVERSARSSASCSRSVISFQARRRWHIYGARGGFPRAGISACRQVL